MRLAVGSLAYLVAQSRKSVPLRDVCSSPSACFLSKTKSGGMQGILDGKYDDLPEQAFYMVGGIDEVVTKAEKMAKDYEK